MKSLSNFISESLMIQESAIDETLLELMKNAFKKSSIYSKIEYTKRGEPNRFKINRQNAKLIADSINNNNETDLKALTTDEWYELLNDKKLSDSERSDFDSKNGDIIIIDKDHNPKYFIDLKISNEYYGAIAYKSFNNFNKDGWYLLIKLQDKNAILVSHDDIANVVDDGKNVSDKLSKTIWWTDPKDHGHGGPYKVYRRSADSEQTVWDDSYLKGSQLGKIFRKQSIK